MKRLTPSDAMFLYGESRETMMHVAGLLLFTPAPDTPPDFLRQLMDDLRAGSPVFSPWNLKLRTPELLRNPLQAWVEEPEVDVEYHVRRTALPSPGDERELGTLISRLHGYAVDFHRPPWEMHLIEGLERNRFALYVKVHHALVDGYTAMRLLIHGLTHDPDDRERPLFFAIPPPERPRREPRPEKEKEKDKDEETGGGIHFAEMLAAIRAQVGATKTVARALVRAVQGEDELVTPLQAPRCVLNQKISRNRRFATQTLEIERIRAVARAVDGTFNDVVLALSATSLRRYLLELDALPAAPLVAMLPVSVRTKDDAGGGNAVGAILASLATDIEDPEERIAEIVASTRTAKQQLHGMSKAQILSYSALLTTPAMLQMMPGVAGRVRPTFNVVISNVPGPDTALYFRGARLDASYPLSIPVHGQGLNITCNSYAGKVCFGFTGCRDTVPHLQRLAVYTGDALVELERAVL
ncbi:MAG: wax ester/triacylglycerol synthase family O-acyltransferase [Deltaproteobacteria bacterium]|nr:wax ester/triacylglycerol synthase family O-acyltransferase [Deltaproteobacteria bacterium]